MVLSNLYVAYYRVEMLETMEFILKEYRRQVSDLRKSFFQVLTTVFDTLRETFTENLQVLSGGVECGGSSAWKLVSVNEMRVNCRIFKSREKSGEYMYAFHRHQSSETKYRNNNETS